MKFYSLFSLAIIMQFNSLHGSAAATAAVKPTSGVIVSVSSKNVTPKQWKHAKYRLLAAYRQMKLKELTTSSASDTDLDKAKKRNTALDLALREKDRIIRMYEVQNRKLAAQIATLEASQKEKDGLP